MVDTYQSSHLAAEHLLDIEVGTAPVAVLAEPRGFHAVAEVDVVSSLVTGQQHT